MICPKCESSIMEGSTLCVKCGVNLKEYNNQKVEEVKEVAEPQVVEPTPVVRESPVEEKIEEVKEVAEPQVVEPTPVVRESPVEEKIEEVKEVAEPQVVEPTPVVRESSVEEKVEEVKEVAEPQVVEPTSVVRESPVEEKVEEVKEVAEPQVVEPTPITTETPVEEVPNTVISEPINNQTTSNNKKNPNIIIFIIIGIVILCGLGFLISKLIPGKSTQQNIEEQFTSNLILIEKDGKYGYIDTDGNQILEPIYEEATDFHGNYAMVRKTEEYKYGEDNKYTGSKEVYYIINKKGETILTSSVNHYTGYGTTMYAYFDDYSKWLFDGKIYDQNLKQLSPDDVIVMYDTYYTKNIDYIYWESPDSKKLGIISIDGKVTYTYEKGEDESMFDLKFASEKSNLKQQYCSITYYSNRKHYSNIVNCATGKVVVDFEEKEYYAAKGNIFDYTDYSTSDYLEESYYIEDDKVELKVGPAKGAGIYYNARGFLSVRESKNSKVYYYDLKTKTKMDEVPEKNESEVDISNISLDDIEIKDAWETYTGYKKQNCNGKLGLVKDKNTILNCDWEKIEYINLDLYKYLETKGKHYIYAYKDRKWNLVDIKTSNIVFELDYYDITESNESPVIYYKNSNNKNILLNLLTLTTMEVDRYNDIKLYNGYFTVKENKVLYYYNNDFKLIYTKE